MKSSKDFKGWVQIGNRLYGELILEGTPKGSLPNADSTLGLDQPKATRNVRIIFSNISWILPRL